MGFEETRLKGVPLVRIRLQRMMVEKHIPLLVGILIVFIIGIGLGAVSVQSLSPGQQSQVESWIGGFISALPGGLDQVERRAVLNDRLQVDLTAAGIVWLTGLTFIGLPVILLTVLVRGFSLGFSVGVLVLQRGLDGVWLAAAAVLPQSLLAVPAFILFSTVALRFALRQYRRQPFRRRSDFWQAAAAYTFRLAVISMALVVAGVVEAYLTPPVIGFVANLVL